MYTCSQWLPKCIWLVQVQRINILDVESYLPKTGKSLSQLLKQIQLMPNATLPNTLTFLQPHIVVFFLIILK